MRRFADWSCARVNADREGTARASFDPQHVAAFMGYLQKHAGFVSDPTLESLGDGRALMAFASFRDAKARTPSPTSRGFHR
jgi:hypothetical protein